MFKNVATKIELYAFDTTTGAAKTGDAANITAYVSKDHGAVTVLGDTSATEMDATNAKGWYLFDVAQAETNADTLLFSGKSSTANISVVGVLIYPTPNNFSSLSVDSNGRVDVIKVAGTTQTAGDIMADTNDIQARLPAALTAGGNIKADALAWNGLTTVALPLVPTVAGNTLDVTATGEAGIDWANVGSKTTVVDLSNTTIKVTQKVDVDTIKTNPVVNGGTVTFPTNATLASTTNITAGTITTVTTVTTVTGLTASNLDTTVSSRMASYTQPTGFLAATFPSGTIANTTNITAGTMTTTTTATNLTTNNDKTGYGLSSAAVQAIWDAATTALTTVGSVGKRIVDFLTGDAYVRIGATGSGLTTLASAAQATGIQSDVDDIQTRLPASLIQGHMDSISNLRTGTAQAGAISTITLDASASTGADAYKDCWIAIVAGTGATQIRMCAGYNGGSKLATIVPDWNTQPDNTSVFVVVPAGPADIWYYLGVLAPGYPSNWSNLFINGSGQVTIGAITGGAITSASIATAAKESIADVLLGRSIAGGANTGRKVGDALKILRNKVTIIAGVMTVYEDDDTTPAWDGAVTTTAGNPISAIDPS